MRKDIAETSTITPRGARWRARIIEGDIWGSSGYYPREVLERDGPTAWPEGTHVYFDHPGEAERHDRPERSVRDLAGRLSSTPVYEADGLYADIQLYTWAAPIVAELADDVGLSIRAAATLEEGQRDGRTGPVVSSLIEGVSVDLVTRAGAGGRLVALLESARTPHTAEDESNNPGKEPAMPSEVAAAPAELTEADKAVVDLTETNAQLTQRVELAEAALRKIVADTNHDLAESIVAGSGVGFNTLEAKALLIDLPLAEDGRLDRAAMSARVDEAAVTVTASRGQEPLTGFNSVPADDVSESDIDTAIASAFGRAVKGA